MSQKQKVCTYYSNYYNFYLNKYSLLKIKNINTYSERFRLPTILYSYNKMIFKKFAWFMYTYSHYIILSCKSYNNKRKKNSGKWFTQDVHLKHILY